jgi:hypothetical protein
VAKILSIALALAVAFVCLASPAQAGDWIEGDGYRFRLPDGFVEASGPGGGTFSQSMGLGGMFGGSDLEMEMKAFMRNPASPDQGMLAVMRMLVTGPMGKRMREQFDPATLRQQLATNRDQAQAMLAQRGMDLDDIRAITLGAKHEGIEMRMETDQGMGMGQTMRMAIAVHEDSMYMFMLVGSPENETEDNAAWATLTTSVKLEAPNRIVRFVKKNWPFLAGGLVIVLLFVLLNLKSGSPRGRSSFGGRTGDGGGFSRPMDGLPTYGFPDAGAPDEAPARPQSIPRASPASPPTIPRSVPAASPPVNEPPAPLPPPAAPGGNGYHPVSTPGKRTIPISKQAADSPAELEAPPVVPSPAPAPSSEVAKEASARIARFGQLGD